MERDPEKGYRGFQRALSLSEGENRVVVQATDESGLSAEKELVAVFERPRGRVHIIAIGIDRYSDARIPALKYAVPDARAVVETLRRALGLAEGSGAGDVELLTDEAATSRAIKLALGTRLVLRESREDTVIVYYSGHGGLAPDRLSADGIEKYLLPVDADAADYAATALPMREVGELFDRLESERVIFIADTCYSGAAGGRTVKPIGRDFRALPQEGIEKRLEGVGRVILTASNASEVAQELDDLGHGVFTHFVLQGIGTRAADTDGDGKLTVSELYAFVSAGVRERTGGTQNPQITNRLGGEITVPIVAASE
jgi:uncharacterized caspase-like protein